MSFCPKCGVDVKNEASFCPSCGYALSVSTIPPIPQAASIPDRATQRPMGIAVIAALEVLGGLVFLGLGAIMLLIAGILGTGLSTTDFPVLGSITGIIIGMGGVILALIGTVNFVIAYGYWNGRGWAWIVGLAFAALGIIIGLITLPGGLIRIVLDVLIIYYLTRPHVKIFFGK